MAKKLNEVFKNSLETTYANIKLPLSILGLNNGQVKLDKVSDGKKYNVQRQLRIKAKDNSANDPATGASTMSGLATKMIATLDQLGEVTWTTVDTVNNNPLLWGIAISPTHTFDKDDIGAKNSKALAEQVSHSSMRVEEVLTTKVVTAATDKGVLDLADAQATADSIQAEVERIKLLVDDYKAYSNGTVAVVHPSVATVFAKLQGQGYSMGTNTFPKGYADSFTYNGTEFAVSNILNAIDASPTATPNTAVVGAIVLDKESLIVADPLEEKVSFDNNIAGNRFVGIRTRDISLVVDPDRISYFSIVHTASKKVDA